MAHADIQKTALITALFLFCPLLGALGGLRAAHAETTTVAVAANFTATAKALQKDFEAATGHKLVLSFGSTGKLYAQIVQDAPFDAFLAADAQRPQKLEHDGVAVLGSRFTYARGELALWSPKPGLDVKDKLETGRFNKLAIANPQTAPYGVAALQTLETLGLTRATQDKWVKGDSIAQTRQFVSTGAAELGFVAYAQVVLDKSGSTWKVPGSFHAPIEQQAVLLERGAENPAATSFLTFIKSANALKTIQSFGYGIKE